MRRLLIIIFFLAAVLMQYSTLAQDSECINVQFQIPEVALVDIEPGSNSTVRFNVQPAHESGQPPSVISANQSLWINYTSAQRGKHARNIYAQITSGHVPQGLKLAVSVSDYQGSGNGRRLGRGQGRIVLTNYPRRIISGIKNCYTGDGTYNGHKLVFSLEIKDYAKISSNNGNHFVVTYTLSDN